jgi:hypothetical protein
VAAASQEDGGFFLYNAGALSVLSGTVSLTVGGSGSGTCSRRDAGVSPCLPST